MPETMCASLPLAEVFQDEHLDPARGSLRGKVQPHQQGERESFRQDQRHF